MQRPPGYPQKGWEDGAPAAIVVDSSALSQTLLQSDQALVAAYVNARAAASRAGWLSPPHAPLTFLFSFPAPTCRASVLFELEEALIAERWRVGAAEAETKVVAAEVVRITRMLATVEGGITFDLSNARASPAAATLRDELQQLNIVHTPSAEVTSWRAVSPRR